MKSKHVSSAEKKTRPHRPKDQKINNAENDLARRTGDWATYKYYAKAAGYSSISFFIGTCVVYAGALKAPGKAGLTRNYGVSSRLYYRTNG